MKKALITGITGQDGSYLAELLLEKGYEVHGIIRRSSSFNTERLDDIYQDPHVPDARLKLHYGDLNDASSLNRLLRILKPDEIYNLGAQSHVRVSFDVPEYTAEVTGVGTVRLLEAIRESGINPRFYQASSSELYARLPVTVPRHGSCCSSRCSPVGRRQSPAMRLRGPPCASASASALRATAMSLSVATSIPRPTRREALESTGARGFRRSARRAPSRGAVPAS